ncbi:Na+/H+ antiporter subunit E [Corynebacterium sp.]|uniref:Na+/H+ antiporter subunit E n=1 Tax=Corynebacterium sp. TaxID=1720 RepID=UPI0026DC8E12|nr:Na+/H+ antiporter subunit E [Corynebacterium sp.]MDO5032291.1 Na+/H+ antiporter subunit E [Corynebacterium sp.]
MLSGFKHRFRPWFMVGTVLMWCLLMGEFSVANLVGGLLVSLFVVFALPLPAMPISGISVSWGKLVVFAVQWCIQLLQASVKVSWLAIRPQEPPKSAIVVLPMRLDSEFILATAVGLYNLQPGGTVTEIDIANRMLTIHLLSADTEEELQREIDAVAKLEADMIAIFERNHR